MANILIVEDEALVALVVEEILVEAGFQVCGIAAGPEEALALAAEHAPDLAVVDVRLARGGDGIALAEMLMAQRPIVILYATGNPGDVKSRARVGFGCLSKPFQPGSLVAAVRLVQYAASMAGDPVAVPRGFFRLVFIRRDRERPNPDPAPCGREQGRVSFHLMDTVPVLIWLSNDR